MCLSKLSFLDLMFEQKKITGTGERVKKAFKSCTQRKKFYKQFLKLSNQKTVH